MLQRHKLEINSLHRRPHHPILLQGLHIRAFQLLFRIAPFHDGHTAQEAEHVRSGEDTLVCKDTGGNGQVGPVGDVDAAG